MDPNRGESFVNRENSIKFLEVLGEICKKERDASRKVGRFDFDDDTRFKRKKK